MTSPRRCGRAGCREPLLYAPDRHSTVADVAVGRDAVYAAIFQNVDRLGACLQIRRRQMD